MKAHFILISINLKRVSIYCLPPGGAGGELTNVTANSAIFGCNYRNYIPIVAIAGKKGAQSWSKHVHILGPILISGVSFRLSIFLTKIFLPDNQHIS